MSVNVSGVHLRDAKLTHQIAETLRCTGLDARGLVLELTEGIAIDNPAEAKTVLMQLRALGIRISIDDFGTGYSSLAYLHELPVDMLKIDQSFVRRLHADSETGEIVRTIIQLAHTLGMIVVAEGIETSAAAQRLREFGCDVAQGYFYAKPMSGESFEIWLKDRPRVPVVAVPVSCTVDDVTDTVSLGTF